MKMNNFADNISLNKAVAEALKLYVTSVLHGRRQNECNPTNAYKFIYNQSNVNFIKLCSSKHYEQVTMYFLIVPVNGTFSFR